MSGEAEGKAEKTEAAVQATERPLKRKRLGERMLIGIVSAFVVVYSFKPDWASAIWYWPAWIWSSLLAVCLLPLLAVRKWKLFCVLFALVCAFGFAFDDMLRASFRALLPGGELQVGPIMIVSLNCAGGSPEAAQEAIESGAELVLLQESPGESELRKIANDGDVVAGPDGSIVAKGILETLSLPQKPNFTWAIWTTTRGRKYFVISLRLQPPTFRLDYWNPDCWRAYADDRKRRAEELKEIVDYAIDLAIDGQIPWIIGGDFNGTSSEEFQDSLKKIAFDSFAIEGRGWGGTGTNDYPFVRFDQIWVSKLSTIVGAEVRATKHSDHRMAIAFLQSPGP